MTEVVTKIKNRVYDSKCPNLSAVGVCLCLVVLFTGATTLCFGQSKTLTNDDILKLIKAGFGERTILKAIHTKESDFDTSTDAIIALKDAGVSEKIIAAMFAVARTKDGLSDRFSKEDDNLPNESGVYVFKDDRHIGLLIERVSWGANYFGLYFNPVTTAGGIPMRRLTAYIDNSKSKIQLSGNIELLIVCSDNTPVDDYYLLRAKSGKNKREFQFDFEVLDGGGLLPIGGTNKTGVPFEAIEIAPRKFKLKLPTLGKGEFAFVSPEKRGQPRTEAVGIVYTFGLY